MRRTQAFVATVFCVLFTVIEETASQTSCSNPISKFFSEVQLFGVAQSYNLSSIECSNILKYNCCMPKYFVFISTNFYQLKSDTLDFWLNYLQPLMYSFVDSYEEFLSWYSTNEAAVNSKDASADVSYWRTQIANLDGQKKQCFQNIWKHTATMKCMVCLSDYKTNFQMLRNRTVEVYLSEDMCQTIQKDCADYAANFVEVTEKARYMFEWVKNALGVPSYSDAEIQNITNYYKFTRAMFNCRSTGLCRDLCGTFINGRGFDQNYTIPDVIYFQWFIDTFIALKKMRVAAGIKRILPSEDAQSNSVAKPPLIFGSVFNYDNSWSPQHQAYLSVLAKQREVSSARRVLASSSAPTNAYQQLMALQRTYVSNMMYSNEYKLNTFNLYSKVRNMTNEDDYQFGAVLQVSTLLLVISVGLVGF